jgi:hypothetical protein
MKKHFCKGRFFYHFSLLCIGQSSYSHPRSIFFKTCALSLTHLLPLSEERGATAAGLSLQFLFSQLVPKHTLINVWLSWTMVISLVALVPIDLNRESPVSLLFLGFRESNTDQLQGSCTQSFTSRGARLTLTESTAQPQKASAKCPTGGTSPPAKAFLFAIPPVN